MVDYATLAEVRSFGQFKDTDTANNDELEALISRVSAMIDKLTGRKFGVVSDTTEYFGDADRDGRDILLHGRLDKLLTLTSITNGDGTSVATGDVLLLPRGADRANVIRLKASSLASWSTGTDEYVEITGKWGYSTSVPEDIRLACIESVIYIHQNRKTLATSERAQASGDGLISMPTTLPARAMKVIAAYKRGF